MLPVTSMASGATPSRSKAARADSVGAKCSGDDGGGQAPVRLFREGRADVPAAQPGLHVADGDLPVETGEGGHEHGRGVALHEGHVGTVSLEPAVDLLHEARGQARQCLARLHDREIDIHREAELPGHLLEHLAVLAGGDDAAGEVRGGLEGGDDGRHLDALGARAHEHGHRPAGAHAGGLYQARRRNQARPSFCRK